ncbi:MAG: 3-oxoacyl-ACP synthase III [Planctomycetes bacterium]|nr:3-oxoacyl-ACP synthase III [Planctomycetota bacterium]
MTTRYHRVHLEAIGYELAPIPVLSTELEERLEPLYRALHIGSGQVEALTGVTERRWWPAGYRVSDGAIAAARDALDRCDVPASALETVIFASVCREQMEPATACRVAHGIGASRSAAIHDLSNACLGVVNAVHDIANRIELGQIRAGIVVACESARDINEIAITRMLERPEMPFFIRSLATLTGGSGAAAMILSDGSFHQDGLPRLRGGVTEAAPEHHELCIWGHRPIEGDDPWLREEIMSTDSVAVLTHGVELGLRTWRAFLTAMDWTAGDVDRTICHQVGSAHRSTILDRIEVPPERDFITYPFLGNMGTVSIPLTAALAAERGVLEPGQNVAFLGIGSGLNCAMQGWSW